MKLLLFSSSDFLAFTKSAFERCHPRRYSCFSLTHTSSFCRNFFMASRESASPPSSSISLSKTTSSYSLFSVLSRGVSSWFLLFFLFIPYETGRGKLCFRRAVYKKLIIILSHHNMVFTGERPPACASPHADRRFRTGFIEKT